MTAIEVYLILVMSYIIYRTKKIPEYYYQTGDIELVRRSTLLSGSVSGSSVYPLLINHDQVFDIDTIADLQKVEQHLDKLYKS